jgi:hypothetical protein
MAAQDPLGRLTTAAGALVGGVGFIYVVGALSLSMRYEGYGLPGQHAAAVSPREVLLTAGLRTLVVWVAIGSVIAWALTWRGRRPARWIKRQLRTKEGIAAAVLIGAALLCLRVVWPFVAYLGILATAYATATWWSASSVKRLLVTALAIGATTVAYEADRISYIIERTCLNLTDPARRTCGLLVGQQDRGFYVGVRDSLGVRLVFVPAARVTSASTQKEPLRVRAGYRRQTVFLRLPDLRVR